MGLGKKQTGSYSGEKRICDECGNPETETDYIVRLRKGVIAGARVYAHLSCKRKILQIRQAKLDRQKRTRLENLQRQNKYKQISKRPKSERKQLAVEPI